MSMITTPQPTRGQLLEQVPLLDFAVPTMPRSMTRPEWRRAGYFVKQRQEPIYKAWQQDARYYGGEWHSGMLGVYTKDQCETFEQYWAAKSEREANEAASTAEWSKVAGFGHLGAAARRLYAYLVSRAKAENTDTLSINNKELAAACRIGRNDLKACREELSKFGLVLYRLTKGRQALVTLKAFQG